MTAAIILATCLFAALISSGISQRFGGGGGRIVGGHDAEPHSAPYMISIRVQLRRGLLHQCGGSLITWRSILTALHCMLPDHIQVAVAGDHRISTVDDTEQHRQIIDFRCHPDYTGGIGPNDIAVANVATPFEPTIWVNLIALPVAGVIPVDNSTATLYGWGSISNTTETILPDVLQVASMEVISIEKCRATTGYPNLLAKSNLCTGPIGLNVDACIGDSGGPLVQVNDDILRVIGTVSWGAFPCGPGPSIKVRISEFITFIHENWIQ